MPGYITLGKPWHGVNTWSDEMVAWFYVYVASCDGYQLPSCPLFWSVQTVCTPQWPLIFLTCPMSTARTHKHVTHEPFCAWKFAMPSVEMTMYASFPEKQTTNKAWRTLLKMIWLREDMIMIWWDSIMILIWFERMRGQMNEIEWMNDHHLLLHKKTQTFHVHVFFAKKGTSLPWKPDEISLLPVKLPGPPNSYGLKATIPESFTAGIARPMAFKSRPMAPSLEDTRWC